jgi:hypothetical protein
MKNDKNVILTIVITIVIGVAMFMALTSWVTQSPCPLLRPIGEFVHHWWTAIPINVLGALVLRWLWRGKKIAA